MAIERVKVATGHNNAAGLAEFMFDPWMPGIKPGIVRISISGEVREDGKPSAEFRWSPKVPDSVIQDARTKCGLTGTIIQAKVTVRLPTNTNRTTFANYNATAFIDGEAEYEREGWKDFVIKLLFLEAI